jgi:hypothetical protein
MENISSEGADRRQAIILSLLTGAERTSSQEEVMDTLQVALLYFTAGQALT